MLKGLLHTTFTETQNLKSKNCDDISKVLPYKSKTVKVETIDDTFQRKSIRVMELSLLQAFHQFKTEHPEFKVGKWTFQLLRPKNITLKAAAK